MNNAGQHLFLANRAKGRRTECDGRPRSDLYPHSRKKAPFQATTRLLKPSIPAGKQQVLPIAPLSALITRAVFAIQGRTGFPLA